MTEEDLGQTLLEADCVPGVSFTVRPKSSEGVVTTPLAVGTDFEASNLSAAAFLHALVSEGLLVQTVSACG